jgi:hypothetical protein
MVNIAILLVKHPSETQSLEEIRNSPQGRHVRKLLQYPMHIEEDERYLF